MSEKKHTTPAASIEDLQKQVDTLEQYVVMSIKNRDRERIKQIETEVRTLADQVVSLDDQIRGLQAAVVNLGGRLNTLPVVDVN
ncbi:MAG: hypothetical protein WCC95_18310 [Candidatus Sulfotelmatobacter sp.]